jgi:hypothetical protein
VVLAPGAERAYREAEWRDALVVIERGEVDLELIGGGRCRLRQGAVIWLTGLPLGTIRNPGSEPALLVATSRR